MSDSLNVHVIITKHLWLPLPRQSPSGNGPGSGARRPAWCGAPCPRPLSVCRPVSWAGILGAPLPGLGELQGCTPSLSAPIAPRQTGGGETPSSRRSPAGTLHRCACRGGAVGHSAHAVGVFKRRCLNLKNQSKRSSFPPKVTYYLTQLNAVLEAGWRACVCCLDPASTIPDPAGRGSRPLARPGHTRGHGLCAP